VARAASNGIANSLTRKWHDPQTKIWRVSSLFAQEELQNRPPQKFRNFLYPESCRSARACGSVFQANVEFTLPCVEARGEARTEILRLPTANTFAFVTCPFMPLISRTASPAYRLEQGPTSCRAPHGQALVLQSTSPCQPPFARPYIL
jgi:hypothetical protein